MNSEKSYSQYCSWSQGAQSGEAFNIRINGKYIGNVDEFDDSVIAHEVGHLVSKALFSANRRTYPNRDMNYVNVGSSHDPAMFWHVPTMTYEEGFCTFFQSMVKQQTPYFQGLDPTIRFEYLDEQGPSLGHLIGLDFITSGQGTGTFQGLFSERSVARALWKAFAASAVFNQGVSPMMNSLVQAGHSEMTDLLRWCDGSSQALRPSIMNLLAQENIVALPGDPQRWDEPIPVTWAGSLSSADVVGRFIFTPNGNRVDPTPTMVVGGRPASSSHFFRVRFAAAGTKKVSLYLDPNQRAFPAGFDLGKAKVRVYRYLQGVHKETLPLPLAGQDPWKVAAPFAGDMCQLSFTLPPSEVNLDLVLAVLVWDGDATRPEPEPPNKPIPWSNFRVNFSFQ